MHLREWSILPRKGGVEESFMEELTFKLNLEIQDIPQDK